MMLGAIWPWGDTKNLRMEEKYALRLYPELAADGVGGSGGSRKGNRY